jgi:hypothetical protein
MAPIAIGIWWLARRSQDPLRGWRAVIEPELLGAHRGELPEAVTLVLRPKGKYRIPRSRNLRSRHGLSPCRLKWRVVELWTIPAEDLLQAHDVGWSGGRAFVDAIVKKTAEFPVNREHVSHHFER